MEHHHFSTVGTRFKDERIRWEKRTGLKFEDNPSFSKSVIVAIEHDMGGIKKQQRLETMIIAGMDVHYILTGRRFIHHNDAEHGNS